MSKNVVALFRHTLEAEDAIAELQKAGFARDHISIVASNAATASSETGTKNTTAGGAEAGAVVGGIAGLLAGLGALAVPGLGPIIAAGPLAVALGGAGVGAAAGGLIGALSGLNIPESDANYYAESIRRGAALVSVRTDDEHADRAREVLDRAGAVDDGTGGGLSEQDVEEDLLRRSNRPDVPQITRSGARVYMSGLELDPRKSTFEDFERDYRAHFAAGSHPGSTYEELSPAYRYGYELARDPRFQNRGWSEIEADARTAWETRQPDTWDSVKDAVRHAFERRQTTGI
jgi:hypothetical protein